MISDVDVEISVVIISKRDNVSPISKIEKPSVMQRRNGERMLFLAALDSSRLIWVTEHRAGSFHKLSLVPRLPWTGMSATITLDIVFHSQVCVGEKNTGDSVSEELDLVTLGNRGAKNPTRHPHSLTLFTCFSTRLTT